MEDLRNVMRLIDIHNDKIPEGDYLELCNSLHNVFKERETRDMSTLVNYEQFNIVIPDVSGEILDHFYDHYYNVLLEYERDFLIAQRLYLNNELDTNRPIQRISKTIKNRAIAHYCHLHSIHLDLYDAEHLKRYHDENNYDIGESGTKFETGLAMMYKSYMAVENDFRSTYCHALRDRLDKINAWIDKLDDM